MLQALDYHLLAPSSVCFLQRYLTAGRAHTELNNDVSDTITHLAQVIGACANPHQCVTLESHSHIDHNGPDLHTSYSTSVSWPLCILIRSSSTCHLKLLPPLCALPDTVLNSQPG